MTYFDLRDCGREFLLFERFFVEIFAHIGINSFSHVVLTSYSLITAHLIGKNMNYEMKCVFLIY